MKIFDFFQENRLMRKMIPSHSFKRLIKAILLISVLIIPNKIIFGQCNNCLDPRNFSVSTHPAAEVKAIVDIKNIHSTDPYCQNIQASYSFDNAIYQYSESKCYNSPNSNFPSTLKVKLAGSYGKGEKRAKDEYCVGTVDIDSKNAPRGVVHKRTEIMGIDGIYGEIEYYVTPFKPRSVKLDPNNSIYDHVIEDKSLRVELETYPGHKIETWDCRMQDPKDLSAWRGKGTHGSRTFNIRALPLPSNENEVGVRVIASTYNQNGDSDQSISRSCWAVSSSITIVRDFGVNFSYTNPKCRGGNTTLRVRCDNIVIGTTIRLEINGDPVNNDDFPLSRSKKEFTHSMRLNRRQNTYQIFYINDKGQPYELTNKISFTVTEPPLLRIDSLNIKHVSCSGDTDGAITIHASGGTGTKRYSLSRTGPYSLNNTISGLNVGNYTVWVQDANFCRNSGSATIGVSENFTINSVSAIDEKCVDANDGEIVFDVTGDNSPFRYSLDGGTTYSTSHVIGGLSPGVYNSFTVWDSNQCEKIYIDELTIGPANPLFINSVTYEDVTVCSDSLNGSITIDASGGAGGYVYIVNGTEYVSPTITGLGKGTYNISIRDVNDCIEIWPDPIVIDGPSLLVIDDILETDVTGCKGDPSGEIEVLTSGGTDPLLYILIPESGSSVVQGNPHFTGLIQDFYYNMVVRDANGCIAQWQDTIILDGPVGVLLDSVRVQDVTGCSYHDNGEIEIFAHGGTPELSYSINGGASYQLNNLFQNVAAGNYDILTSDGEGCSQSFTGAVHVNSPAEIEVYSVGTQNIECYGDSTGRILLTAGAGDDTLNYSIDGGNTQPLGDFGNLPAGNHIIRIQNQNNCFLDTLINVYQNPEIEILSVSVSNISCNGENDGEISIDAIGGVDLTYSIDDTTYWPENVIGTLIPGAYNIFVKDRFSCKKEWENNPVTITEPKPLTFVDTTFITPTCTDKGDVIAHVTGGTPFYNGYHFILTNASEDTSATMVGDSVVFEDVIPYVSGLYTLEVQDSNGCSVKKGLDDWVIPVVGGIPIVVEDSIVTMPTCYGASDGSIQIVSVSGGTGVYESFEWRRPAPWNTTFFGQTITNLDFGPYLLTITDDEGCTSDEVLFMVQNPPQLEIIADVTEPKCVGESNGSIEITGVENGVPDFTYEWADSTGTGTVNIDTAIQNNLSSGIYKITVTDSQGCQRENFITVNDPEVLIASIIPDSSFNGFDVACFGDLGTASAQGAGGTEVYSYSWSNGVNTANANGLDPGTRYTVTVTDSNNCTDTASIILTEPVAMESSITPDTIFEDIYHVKCFGDLGSATASGLGGVAPYTYEWYNGVTGQKGTSLDAGIECFVMVNDANGCIDTAYTTLRQPEDILTTITADSIYNGYDVACYGNEGSATAFVQGGIYPYSYNWSNGETTASAYLQSEVAYTITVTDKMHCVDTATVTLDAPNSFIMNVVSDNDYHGYDVNCYGELGSATASGIDGVPPYTYEWSNGETTPQAVSLQPGVIYSVTMTDANGCTAVGEIILQEPDSLYISGIDKSDVICKGDGTGAIDITVAGGAGAYSYSWSTLDGSGLYVTEEDQSALTSGTYVVNISDENSCSYIETIAIDEPDLALEMQITDQINVSCNSYYNGSVTLEATNGWGNFMYSKDSITYQSSNIFDHLPATNYKFFVRDQGGCIISLETEISQPDALSASITVLNEISCSGGNDGSFTVSANGGTTPYNYSIDNGFTIQQNEIFGQLSEGSYSVLIIDSNNCTLDETVNMIQPSQLELSILTMVEATCGNSDGSVTVEALSGTPPYTYEWKDVAVFGQELTNVPAGVYELSVTDSNGCESIFYVDINNSDGPVLELAALSNASCYSSTDGSAEVNVIGGVAPLQFLWNDPMSQTNSLAVGLSPGNYTVTVTDASGCNDQLSVDVGPENGISIEFISQDVTCKGGTNGQVIARPNGGIVPYSYLWRNQVGNEIGSDSIIIGLSAGQYIVEVWDANNCPNGLTSPGIIDTVTISEPFLPLEIEVVDQANVACYGENSAWVQVFAAGGQGDIMYSSDDLNYSSSRLFTNLPAGNTEFFARDNNQCVASINIQISQPDQLMLVPYEIIPVSCSGSDDASIILSASGGTSAYSYRRDGDALYAEDSIFQNLSAGTFTFYVLDNNGCESSSDIQITEPDVLGGNILQNIGSTCGHADGSATVEAIGGTQPYDYLWNDENQQSTSRASALLPGIYNVIISDANNCLDTLEIEIENIPGPEIEIESIQSISCIGDTDGSAGITITGGVGPYSTIWNDPLNQTGLEADSLASGTYQVIVTDVNECSDTLNVSIPSVDSLLIVLENLINPICLGDPGSINVLATGGTSPYTYIWDNGVIGENNTGLDDGQYHLTVIDAHNCMVNSSYDILGAGEEVHVDIPESAIVCLGQEITLDAGIPDASYSWSSDNGFASTNQIVNLVDPGIYTLIVTNEHGCSGTAEFQLIASENSLDAGILMVDEASVGDTIVVCELTWPIPDSIIWEIPQAFTVLDEDQDHKFLLANESGTYMIAITALFQECIDYAVNSIIINEGSYKDTDMINKETGNSVFSLIDLFPNPTNGEFILKITLTKQSDVIVELYDLLGLPVLKEHQYGETEYSVTYNIENLNEGIYLLIIKSRGEIKTMRLIKN